MSIFRSTRTHNATPLHHARRLGAAVLCSLFAIGLAATGCDAADESVVVDDHSQVESLEESDDSPVDALDPSEVASLEYLLPVVEADGVRIDDPAEMLGATTLEFLGVDGHPRTALRTADGFALLGDIEAVATWATDHRNVQFDASDRSFAIALAGTHDERRTSLATVVLLGLGGQLASLQDLAPAVAERVDECSDDSDCAWNEFCHTMFANDCREKKEEGDVCSRHGKCLSGCCKVHWTWPFQKTCRPAEDCQ